MAVEELPEPPPNAERFVSLADRTLQSGGWCMPSGYDFGALQERAILPSFPIRRGGIRWPRWPIATKVVKDRPRRWYVEASYPRPEASQERETERIGPFAKRRHAEQANLALIQLNNRINELYWAERRSNEQHPE